MATTKRINANIDIVKFGKALDDSLNSLTTVPSLSFHRLDLDPNTPPESTESVESFKSLVRNGPLQGGEWDAHIIGAGLRVIPSLTLLFEDLMNTIVSTSKTEPKLMFSANAADHLEVVKRRTTELKMGDRPGSSD